MRSSQEDRTASPMDTSASELRSKGASWSGFESNELFVADGRGFFDRVSGLSGTDTLTDTRTHVLVDIDRDGFQDIALVNSNAPTLQLFRNRIGELQGSAAGGMIALRFVGASRQASASKVGNRDGYGAVAYVHLADGRVLRRDHQAGEGLAGLNSTTRLVGLGDATRAEKVVVRWPSGRETATEGVPAGSLLTAWEDATQAPDGAAFSVSAYRPADAVRLPRAHPGLRGTLPAELASRGTAPLRAVITMASWCEACASEVPALHALRAAVPAAELDLIGVSVDAEDTPEKLAQWVDTHKPPYPLVEPLSAPARAAVEDVVRRGVGHLALPAAILIDAGGQILGVIAGRPTLSDVRAAQASLAPTAPEPAPAPAPEGAPAQGDGP